LLQVQVLDECRQVVCEGVHIIAIPGLAGTAVAAAVVGDAAVAFGREEEHL